MPLWQAELHLTSSFLHRHFLVLHCPLHKHLLNPWPVPTDKTFITSLILRLVFGTETLISYTFKTSANKALVNYSTCGTASVHVIVNFHYDTNNIREIYFTTVEFRNENSNTISYFTFCNLPRVLVFIFSAWIFKFSYAVFRTLIAVCCTD